MIHYTDISTEQHTTYMLTVGRSGATRHAGGNEIERAMYRWLWCVRVAALQLAFVVALQFLKRCYVETPFKTNLWRCYSWCHKRTRGKGPKDGLVWTWPGIKGKKRSGHEADHLSVCSAENKTSWNYTGAPCTC